MHTRHFPPTVRDAAELLVGWYLMTPHLSCGTPLKWWDVRGTFKTETECLEALKNYPSDPENPYRQDPMVRKLMREGKLIPGQWPFVAKCVATDDPRLKPN